jgi:hypothetical protein
VQHSGRHERYLWTPKAEGKYKCMSRVISDTELLLSKSGRADSTRARCPLAYVLLPETVFLCITVVATVQRY